MKRGLMYVVDLGENMKNDGEKDEKDEKEQQQELQEEQDKSTHTTGGGSESDGEKDSNRSSQSVTINKTLKREFSTSSGCSGEKDKQLVLKRRE